MKNASLFGTIVSEIMSQIVSCAHLNQGLFPGSDTNSVSGDQLLNLSGPQFIQ